jgi:ankyrin repeat protein
MNNKSTAGYVFVFLGCLCVMPMVLAGCGSRVVTSDAKPIDVSDLPAEQQAFVAAQRGDLDTVKEIVKAYPDAVALQDANGRSLLHAAAEADNPDLVAYLLKSGANPALQDSEGRDPMAVAMESRSSKEVVKLLSDALKKSNPT